MLYKRVFDLTCCLIALPVYGPVIVAIILAIKWDDGGMIFFRQERIGLRGCRFCCLKFRTMTEGKVTRVGKWLRLTGLDELAQILNVLRGEMSVVGPRPLTRADISRLGWEKHIFRWELPPGLTGLAQIYNGLGARRSLACDRLYAKKLSLAMDIYIVFISFCINIIGKRKVRQLWFVRHDREKVLKFGD